jgi:hypothetical protein
MSSKTSVEKKDDSLVAGLIQFQRDEGWAFVFFIGENANFGTATEANFLLECGQNAREAIRALV